MTASTPSGPRSKPRFKIALVCGIVLILLAALFLVPIGSFIGTENSGNLNSNLCSSSNFDLNNPVPDETKHYYVIFGQKPAYDKEKKIIVPTGNEAGSCGPIILGKLYL